jgi:hypothetical protein
MALKLALMYNEVNKKDPYSLELMAVPCALPSIPGQNKAIA